ncbi:hypoxanthine phosphoribosyltransferase [Alistipes sp. OttesenSCG-928-L06]|nr:hypoxanthine phosphoribosyltransferase [Alistipes sp. OttesenSCG-928-L06]
MFRRAIPHREIVRHIDLLAEALNAQWKGNSQIPVFVSVLDGAFMFTAELLKRIDFACEVAFIRLSSYAGTESSGEVRRLMGLDGHTVHGRDVIVLEDIVETGNTVEAIHQLLSEQAPRSIAFATLFFKPEAYAKPFKIDHYAMELPNDFVIGFGLDYDQLGRNLRDVYTLITD